MRREYHDRMRLVWKLDVINEAAASGEEARILDPAHRLANAVGLNVELLNTCVLPYFCFRFADF